MLIIKKPAYECWLFSIIWSLVKGANAFIFIKIGKHTMTLSKVGAYFFFIFCLIVLILCYQFVWVFSRTTQGEIMNFGRGVGKPYRVIENVRICYNANNKVYVDTYLRNGLKDTTHQVRIKYLVFAPSVSRMDTLIGNWGLVIVLSVMVLLCLSISFLIQDIVPNGSVFRLSGSFPFVILKKPTRERDPNDQYAW